MTNYQKTLAALIARLKVHHREYLDTPKKFHEEVYVTNLGNEVGMGVGQILRGSMNEWDRKEFIIGVILGLSRTESTIPNPILPNTIVDVMIEVGRENLGAYIPILPGCVTTGRTYGEIVTNIAEAVDLHLEGMKEDGLEIPKEFDGNWYYNYGFC